MPAVPPLTLRPVRPAADAGAIAAIYAHYVATSIATFDFDPPSVEATEEKYATILARGHPAIVGEIDGKVAGYAYASNYRPRPGYRFTCEDSIYLGPEWVGRGYGKLLLARIIDRARAAGFKQMLAVIAGGVEPSVRLHARFGFATLGTFPNLGHKFGQWVDVVHMQKAL
ncbi:MAG: N-acetyltransferase family protein [Cucumibacter sp.]